jgi:hypothetical protein
MSGKNPQVVITWMQPNDNETVCSLAWDGGRGKTRVYDKDHYDARLDIDREKDGPLPYFDKPREAFAWMLADRGKQCQVHITVGRAMGLL